MYVLLILDFKGAFFSWTIQYIMCNQANVDNLRCHIIQNIEGITINYEPSKDIVYMLFVSSLKVSQEKLESKLPKYL